MLHSWCAVTDICDRTVYLPCLKGMKELLPGKVANLHRVSHTIRHLSIDSTVKVVFESLLSHSNHQMCHSSRNYIMFSTLH